MRGGSPACGVARQSGRLPGGSGVLAERGKLNQKLDKGIPRAERKSAGRER